MVASFNSPQKGTGPKNAKYAHGGAEFTTRSRFYKSPNPFCDNDEIVDYTKQGKGGSLSKMSGESKSEKAIKPRTGKSEEASESGAERRRELEVGEE